MKRGGLVAAGSVKCKRKFDSRSGTAILLHVSFTEQDERFMRRALALARRGIGKTSPNPAVGAVLVRGGKIIGEGWHRRAGDAHAEINALRDAGVQRPASSVRSHDSGLRTRDSGLVLYVTLEPCCTHGRTPPCTDAIIAAGVRRVVVAATDPNPKHRGRGLRLLRRAGIRVGAGLLAEEAAALNPGFNKWIVTGMPWVIAKAALSLDGKMATRTGDSKWITGQAARREAHQLRSQVDAIMVGANTVIRDDPQLTLRHGVRGRQPWRVVVGRCPRTARVFTDAHRERTVHFTTRNLRLVLRKLGRMGVTSVLIEGGPTLLRAAFDAGVVDKVAFFFAPKVIAGSATMAKAKMVHGMWRRTGSDMLFEGDVK